MRENIYYWKCDSPLDHKQKQVYNAKYELADISREVREVCGDIFGSLPESVKSSGSEGNHYGYIVSYPDRSYFFRADDGLVDDDYMLAESEIMKFVAGRGIPVPQVFHTDISRSKVPFRFQVIQLFSEPDLNVYYQRGTLDSKAIARQLGTSLARLHNISLAGFGFINTEQLQLQGTLCGLNSDYRSYFYTKLNDHIAYLVDHELVDDDLAAKIESLIERNDLLLELDQASLVHRDIALWNILGRENEICAIIDWDDAVLGEPADDFGILTCFYDEQFLAAVRESYSLTRPLPADFEARRWLHTLRNMLWKMMIRHYMGYFELSGDFFILNSDNRESLRDFTLKKIKQAITRLEQLS